MDDEIEYVYVKGNGWMAQYKYVVDQNDLFKYIDESNRLWREAQIRYMRDSYEIRLTEYLYDGVIYQGV